MLTIAALLRHVSRPRRRIGRRRTCYGRLFTRSALGTENLG